MLFSSSDTFTGCSGVMVKGLNMSKTCQTPRAFTSPAEMSEYVLRLKYEFFAPEHMKERFKGFPAFSPNYIVGNIVKVGGYHYRRLQGMKTYPFRHGVGVWRAMMVVEHQYSKYYRQGTHQHDTGKIHTCKYKYYNIKIT